MRSTRTHRSLETASNRAGKNLRFFKKKIRFLGFNVRTVARGTLDRYTGIQEYGQEEGL